MDGVTLKIDFILIEMMDEMLKFKNYLDSKIKILDKQIEKKFICELKTLYIERCPHTELQK